METNNNINTNVDDANHNNLSATLTQGSTNFNPSLVEFEDSKETIVSSLSTAAPSYTVGPADGDLAKFLSRPIKILSGATNDSTTFLLNPFKNYLANPSVKAKIKNFQLIRATLCVRYSENAIPFVYGCKQLAAIPYYSSTDTRFSNIYANSHNQCQYTNPAVGNPIVFRLPYINNVPYYEIRNIELQTTNGFMWHIKMFDVKAYARSDSATVPNTSYSVHAWLEDVELAIPLATDAVYQSEYKGVISTPATIVGNAAKTLSAIPILKPFTQPVEHASAMISSFAKNFGFSRPVQLEPPVPIMINADHNMAISTYVDNCQKLTVDPKQGVMVDTAMIDGSDMDPLAFSSFTKRETLLDTFVWTQADAIGTFLKQIPVTPAAVRGDVNALNLPAVAIPAIPFKYWHGSMKYRIKIISSTYHRGRMRVYWSPTLLNFSALTEDIFNQLESKVIDIESNKEVEIDVFWGKSIPWEQIRFIPNVLNVTNTGQTNTFVNGFLYFRVSQTLSAPLSTADALVMVFIRGGDDLEFAVRSSRNIGYFHLFQRYQYGVISDRSIVGQIPDFGAPTLPTAHQYQSELQFETSTSMSFNSKNSITDLTDYTMGQRITSFRDLAKTWWLWESRNIGLIAEPNVYRITFPSVPFIPGGNSWGTPSAGTGMRLFDSPITLMNQIFGYYKGGIRYKIVFDTLNVDMLQVEASICRPGNNATYGGHTGYHTQDVGANQTISQFDNYGMAVVKSGNSITFEIPYEYHLSFYTLPNIFNVNAFANHVAIRIFTPPSNLANSDQLHYRCYVSLAEDSNYGLYRGLGTCYMYSVFTDGGPPPGLLADENQGADQPETSVIDVISNLIPQEAFTDGTIMD